MLRRFLPGWSSLSPDGAAAGGSLPTVVALCALANFINSADRVIMPVALASGLAAEHDYTLIQQGWILSAFPAGYMSAQIFQIAGSCFIGTQLGGRKLLVGVVLLWSISTLVTPLVAGWFLMLLLARVALGIGEGLGLPTIYHILAETVPAERRSTAFSYLAAAGSIGQTVAAIISPHFAWEIPFYMFGLMGLYWCLLWIRVRDEFCPAIITAEPLLLSPSQKITPSPLQRWQLFVRTPALLAIYTAHFCMNWTAYVIMHWLPTYLRVYLQADPADLSLAALPYVLNSLASIGVGHVVDSLVSRRRLSLRSARIYATTAGLIGPAILLISFAFVTHLYSAIFMGALAFNSAGHLSNHVDVAPKYAGITFAISNTIATLPGLTVGPLTGRLVVESNGRWWPTFVLAGALNFCGAVIYANFASTTQVI